MRRLVAIAAVQLGFMLGGSIVIESVFSLPGIGFLAWESISKNDFPVVQAVVLLLAALTLLPAMLGFLGLKVLRRAERNLLVQDGLVGERDDALVAAACETPGG